MEPDALDRDGYLIVSNVLTFKHCRQLAEAFETAGPKHGVRIGERAAGLYAMRNVLRLPVVSELAQSKPIVALAEKVLGRGAMAVRGIFFDKTPGANWKVAWHQDLSIAVK